MSRFGRRVQLLISTVGHSDNAGEYSGLFAPSQWSHIPYSKPGPIVMHAKRPCSLAPTLAPHLHHAALQPDVIPAPPTMACKPRATSHRHAEQLFLTTCRASKGCCDVVPLMYPPPSWHLHVKHRIKRLVEQRCVGLVRGHVVLVHVCQRAVLRRVLVANL